MLQKNAVEKVRTLKSDNKQFFSTLFVRPKKDGGLRPIFNLKKLNSFTVYEHFKMEGFHMIKNILKPNDFLCKIDLKDAYFCIPIHQTHRPYLRFRWGDQVMQYRSLPFGLASGPRLFTKLMKPVVAILRRLGVKLIIYLDDILLMNQSREGLIKDRDSLLYLLHNLGWLINWNKSVLQPTQKLEFLGMEVDSTSMMVSLPRDKIEKITKKCQNVIQSDQTTIQELASLIGSLNATVEAVMPAALYVRELQMHQTRSLLKFQSYHAKITLPEACKREILWWIQKLQDWNGKEILAPCPDLTIETDASLKGWGFHCQSLEMRMGGPWNYLEQKLHINALEMMAAENALKILLEGRENIHVHLRMDNMTALTYINRMGGTRSSGLTQIAKRIWEFCLQKKVRLTAEHIPGVQNEIADWESRNVSHMSTNNWKLNKGIFNQIKRVRGPLDLDLFADRQNAQTQAYISWKPDPNAVATDAFLTNWKGKNAYAFPPFCMIPRCLAKVQREGGDLVIITPAWQSQPYYPVLLEMSVDYPILLPPQMDLLQAPGGQQHPLIVNETLKLVAWKISADQQKCRDFQRKLQNYSCQHGGKGHSQLITAAGSSGIAGVTREKLIPFVPLWNI